MIEIPSIEQKNVIIRRFVVFSNFQGITKIPVIFLGIVSSSGQVEVPLALFVRPPASIFLMASVAVGLRHVVYLNK